MILDRIHSTSGSPVDGIGQAVARLHGITAACCPSGLHHPPLCIAPRPEQHRPVLLVREVGKLVQAQPVGPVRGFAVVLVDKPQVVLEYLKPPLPLIERIAVGLAVLEEPGVVHAGQLLLSPPDPEPVLGIVRYDGHVGGSGGKVEEEEEG